MSIFGSIMDKIFHHPAAQASQPASSAQPSAQSGASQDSGTGTLTAPPPAAAAQQVDVGAVLSEMASSQGGGAITKVRSSIC